MTLAWAAIAVGLAAVTAAFLTARARAAESARWAKVSTLGDSRPVGAAVDVDSLAALPAPVARYFRTVLTDRQQPIRSVTLYQSGELRTGVETQRWLPFTAVELVAPAAVGFVWNAKVSLPFGAHVRVFDRYVRGAGSTRVSLLSVLTVASESGTPELNSGALHRYLAEAVWFPTALLPCSGVVWTPIDADSAQAAFTECDTTVSLEFRFNAAGEVASVYSAGRYGRFAGAYERAPWEGHFRDYRTRAGMRVPSYGEVGWYRDGTLRLVWKGSLLDAVYRFES